MSDFFTIASIAWRNLRRNRRRTVLTLITLIAGCGMIIFNNAIFNGGTGQMIEDAVALNSGHLQIHEKGFLDSGTIDYAFVPAPSLLDKLRRMKEQGIVAGFTSRIEVIAMVSTGNVTEGAVIQGLDLPGANGVISIHEKILPGGKLPVPGDHRSVLVGRVLAENLGILPGSDFTMISQAFDGSIAAERLTAAGIIKTGNPLMDSTLILMPHGGVRETFAMGDYIHTLVVRLTPGTDAAQAARELRDAAGDDALEFTTWERLIPEIAQFVVLDNIAGYIFSFILYIVVAFTVLNTIQMAVFERTREFGVLLSIGTTPMEGFFHDHAGVPVHHPHRRRPRRCAGPGNKRHSRTPSLRLLTLGGRIRGMGGVYHRLPGEGDCPQRGDNFPADIPACISLFTSAGTARDET